MSQLYSLLAYWFSHLEVARAPSGYSFATFHAYKLNKHFHSDLLYLSLSPVALSHELLMCFFAQYISLAVPWLRVCCGGATQWSRFLHCRGYSNKHGPMKQTCPCGTNSSMMYIFLPGDSRSIILSHS